MLGTRFRICFSGILAVDFSGFFQDFFQDFFRINSGFCYFLRVSDETLNWLSLDSLQLLRILQDSSINPKHSLRGILSFLSFLLSFFPSFLLSFFPSFHFVQDFVSDYFQTVDYFWQVGCLVEWVEAWVGGGMSNIVTRALKT